MKAVWCLAVLLAVFSQSQAELLGFRSQGSDSETVVVLDSSTNVGADPHFVGVVQQLDLSRPDDSTRQSYTFWPSSSAFIDGGLQTWVEQQMSVLDSLQGLLVPNCPHAAAISQATPPQSDYPTLMSYMAASRFGSPSLLSAYARQVAQDSQPATVGVLFDSETGEILNEEDLTEADPAEDAWEEALPSVASIFRNVEDSLSQNLEQRGNWFGQQYDAAADEVRQEAEPLFRSAAAWAEQQQQQEQQDGQDEQASGEDERQVAPRKLDQDALITRRPAADEEAAWGDACSLGLFVALCIGCIAVWVGMVRAWVSCCALEQQAKAAKKAKAQSAEHTNPLLTPLIPEAASANPAFTGVEVASEHPTQGRFFAPQGTEYVSIAYMPLHSENQSRA